jgi:hypothetical protein
MLQKAPHLTSHLAYTVKDATDQDLYIPHPLINASKVIKVEIGKELCELLSCNPAKEKEMCRPKDETSYYRVGDDGFDMLCQPACFNVSAKPTYNPDETQQPDMPMLNYHDNTCRLVPSSMVTYLEKKNIL